MSPRFAIGGALLAIAVASCASKRPSAGGRHDAGTDAAVAGPRPTMVVLDSVQVELHGRAERVIDPRALGRTLARCLIESGAPVAALADQAPPGRVLRHLVLTLAVTVHEPEPARSSLGVSLEAAGRWADDNDPVAPSASLTGAATPRTEVPAGVDPADAATAAVVLDLEPRLCVELTARLQVWSDDDLRPALAAADPSAIRWALQVAADRSPPTDELGRLELINALARHLGQDVLVRDAAIAALAATRDPRAVAPLTAITDVGDAGALVRIIGAVAELGGDDARDYLQVLTSHRDPSVARAARAGLATLAAAPR